jgi:hypothetical protein
VKNGTLILNQLSVDNYDRLSDKFQNLLLECEGWEISALMEKAVDMIVGVSQEYEMQCFLYAQMCMKLVRHWSQFPKSAVAGAVDGTAKEDSTATNDLIASTESLGDLFKVCLLTRCQHEFEKDREAIYQGFRDDVSLSEDDKDEKI